MKRVVPITWGETRILPATGDHPPLPITVSYDVGFEPCYGGSRLIEITLPEGVLRNGATA